MPSTSASRSCSNAAGSNTRPNASVKTNPDSFAAAAPTQSSCVAGEPSGIATPGGIGSSPQPRALHRSYSTPTPLAHRARQSGATRSGVRQASSNAACAMPPRTSGLPHRRGFGISFSAAQRAGHDIHLSNALNDACEGRARRARATPAPISNVINSSSLIRALMRPPKKTGRGPPAPSRKRKGTTGPGPCRRRFRRRASTHGPGTPTRGSTGATPTRTP